MPRPGVVEPLEAELAASSVVPEADDVATAEGAQPRLVQEEDRSLALGLGMGDAEVERVLVGRPNETSPRRLGDDVLERDGMLELEEYQPPDPGRGRAIRGEVLGGQRRLRVSVLPGGDQVLGGAAVADGDVIDPRRRLRPGPGRSPERRR